MTRLSKIHPRNCTRGENVAFVFNSVHKRERCPEYCLWDQGKVWLIFSTNRTAIERNRSKLLTKLNSHSTFRLQDSVCLFVWHLFIFNSSRPSDAYSICSNSDQFWMYLSERHGRFFIQSRVYLQEYDLLCNVSTWFRYLLYCLDDVMLGSIWPYVSVLLPCHAGGLVLALT